MCVRGHQRIGGYTDVSLLVTGLALDDVARFAMPRRRDVLLPTGHRTEPQLHPPCVAGRDRAADRIGPRRNQLSARGADQAGHGPLL